MRLIAFSDIHGRQAELKVPDGDVLIVAGDLTSSGTLPQLAAFAHWLSELPHRYKLVVAGNHDWCLENELFGVSEQLLREVGAIYLKDSGCEINGIKFWGSPYTPRFLDWAFNVDRGLIKRHWDMIPEDTQVLITHGPPYGICDEVFNSYTYGERVGCRDLLNRVDEIGLLVHFFGHIHCAHGSHERTNKSGHVTQFRNVAVLSEGYALIHEPTVLEITKPL